MSRECNNGKDLLIGFISGAVIGSAIALLYAPKAGTKLRRDLNNRVQDFKEDAEDFIHNAKKKARDAMNDGVTKAEQLVSEVKTKADKLFKDANHLMNDAE